MTISTIGFIGLGVMGEPICGHLARKSGCRIRAYDLSDEPLARLGADGVQRAESVANVAIAADAIFVALPSGNHVEKVCLSVDGLLAHARAGQVIVDLGTTSVATARALATRFAAENAEFVDAPIARTRQAAIDGDLSVMVGASGALYEKLLPLLRCFASDVTACGAVGQGQVMKIMNNMVLAQTVVALSEALSVARAAGVDAGLLFDTLSKGSADSFALRNHGMKALLPETFPERAFSARYMRKDIGYALELARANGLHLAGAELADRLLSAAIAAGDGDRYWPVITKSLGAK